MTINQNDNIGGEIEANLDIASDETSIYADGQLYKFDVDDLRENETAIKQLINNNNIANMNLAALKDRNMTLEIENASYFLKPQIAFLVAALNTTGVVLVGIGAGLITGESPPAYAGWLLGIGIVLSIAGVITPLALPKSPKILNQEKPNASKG